MFPLEALSIIIIIIIIRMEVKFLDKVFNKFKEEKLTIFLISALVIFIVTFPFLLEKASHLDLFKNTNGDFSEWLSFLGSYVGGVISGLTTLAGIYIGMNIEKANRKNDMAIHNLEELYAINNWCYEALNYMNELNYGNRFEKNQILEWEEKAEDLMKSLKFVDIKWYREMRGITIYTTQLMHGANVNVDVKPYIGKSEKMIIKFQSKISKYF